MSYTSWRFGCPKGHRSIKVLTRKDGYKCNTCGVIYDRIKDMKTGEMVDDMTQQYNE